MENKEEITLIIIYKQIQYYFHKCDVKELLENKLKHFAKSNHLNVSTLYILYDGISLFGNQLKKHISEIIKKQDKEDKIMTLLLYQNTEYDITEEDEITIVLSIESVEAVTLNGKKGDLIRDIIKNSSSIKFDLKWCIFKYKAKEIDLNQKLDDIANDNDKKKLKIEITLNYTIPLFVNLVNKKKIYI